MSTPPSTTPGPSASHTSSRHGWRRGLALAFQALVVAQAVLVLSQAVTAGRFLSGDGAWLRWHGTVGTAFLGLALVLQALVALAIWVVARGPAWPAGLTALLFVAEWQQVEAGYGGRLALHVPLGVATFGLVVALLALSRRLTR
jgi:hypothetical protein